LIRAYYQVELRRPIDEHLAVYSAYWSKNYACNPAAIYEKARELAPHIRGVWVIQHQFADRMPAGVDYVEMHSPEYYRVMATAKYFVNNVNFAPNIVKRPGMVHLQTQHGTPLKSMGLRLLEYPVGAAGMNFSKLMERSDRWDYLISSNRFSSEVWERSFPNSYVTLEVGYPRNDRLVTATEADRTAMRARLDLPAGKNVVLYAPTFRDWVRDQFDSPIDLLDFCERLGDDHVVLVRGHYFTERDERLVRLERGGLLRDVSEYPSIEELMIASDVLITDYSSVMFDYANLDRPIVIYAPDWDTYSRVRGVNFDLIAAPPGVVETTQDGLVEAFRGERYRDSVAATLRKEFAQRFCEWDDGHAAERVVRRMFLGGLDAHAQQSTGVAQSDAGLPNDANNTSPRLNPKA
jgi:CDP-glycerol glycerophosphotransferase